MVICRLEPVKRDVDRPAICRPMEMLGTVEPLQNAAGVHIPLGPMQVQNLDVIGRRLLVFRLAGSAAFEKGKELIDHCNPDIECLPLGAELVILQQRVALLHVKRALILPLFDHQSVHHIFLLERFIGAVAAHLISRLRSAGCGSRH